MLIHSNLAPYAELKTERLSILEMAEFIIGFYRTVSSFDSAFSQINVVSEKKPLNDFIDVNANDAPQLLAEEILRQNLKEIQKIDGVTNPTIHHSRRNALMISLGGYQASDYKLLTFNFIFLGESRHNRQSSIGRIVSSDELFASTEYVKCLVQALISSFKVRYLAIKISDLKFGRVCRQYIAPLGWISYFANDYPVNIPDDLPGFDYEYTDSGKLMFSTQEPFSRTRPEWLTKQKEKLLHAMQLIAEHDPNYLKPNRREKT